MFKAIVGALILAGVLIFALAVVIGSIEAWTDAPRGQMEGGFR